MGRSRPKMDLEESRALVSFNPNHPRAADLVVALKAKFGREFVESGIPGSVIIGLHPDSPDSDALLIMEEVLGQSCPALVAYSSLYR
jgi:hypothetical protein